MKISRYRLQTAIMECGKARFRIAQQAGMHPATLHKIEKDGICTGRQCDALAAVIDVEPDDLMA